MDKFKKKLYYKYFDLFQISSFNGDSVEEQYASEVLKWLELNPRICFSHIYKNEIPSSIPTQRFLEELNEFNEKGSIFYIDNYLKSVDKWILDVVLPGYFDNKNLKKIILKNQIESPQELISYFSSLDYINKEGLDKSNLYAHIISSLQWSDFPHEYAKYYTTNDTLYDNFKGGLINGNFHNHTQYSDGTCTIRELVSLAEKHSKKFVGISDHSKRMKGVDEISLQDQWAEISSLQSVSPVKIFKSLECEILRDGSLDMASNALSQLDYVIIAIHTDICMREIDMERRLIRAIENPFSNILAHPSARIYGKKPPILVNMKKIIDACVANDVVIEINGDPSRLDLDPTLIDYASNKGAFFTIDSDTHNVNGYFNINNALQIAEDFKIPPERCLNTFEYHNLTNFFSNQKSSTF